MDIIVLRVILHYGFEKFPSKLRIMFEIRTAHSKMCQSGVSNLAGGEWIIYVQK